MYQPPESIPINKSHFPFIDFLRGIAALWVCVAHCLIWTGVNLPQIASPKLAVDLFMIISGFLMMAQVQQRQSIEPMEKTRNWLIFYLRRYFRIAPAYYLSLMLAVLGSTWFLGGYGQLRYHVGGWLAQAQHLEPSNIKYDINNILTHVTFLFGLHPKLSFSTFLPDWSLSLEMQFYLVFPMIFIACNRWGWLRVTAVIGCISGLMLITFNKSLRSGLIAPDMNFLEPSFLFFKLQYFLIGIIVYSATQEKIKKLLPIGFLLLALCMLDIGQGNAKTLVRLAMTLTIFLMARASASGDQVFANSRLVRLLSDSAYSVYLFHGFFIAAAGWLMAPEMVARPLLMVAWVIPSAYISAQLVERWVERPGIRLGRDVVARLSGRA